MEIIVYDEGFDISKDIIFREKILFLKRLNKILILKRHYRVSTEEVLNMICQMDGLKLKRNKRSFTLKLR